ncbi:anthranilate/para-aminobenzoate synthase component II, partial [Kitasatospora sp. MAP5-34]|nr:anthranilate/para-aminobenzoate synthase component II [Kitasatospora sp. MAP5-34]
GDIHALRGPGFAGLQLHPESVLTHDGIGIVAGLLRTAATAAGLDAGASTAA